MKKTGIGRGLLIASASILMSAQILHAQTLKGSQLTEKTAGILRENKMEYAQHSLVPSYMAGFGECITVETEADSRGEEEEINTVIFAFTQDFFVRAPEFFTKLIDSTKEKKLPYKCVFLFATDDDIRTIKDDSVSARTSGTESFSQTLYDTGSVCAFVVSDAGITGSIIVPETSADASPQWIVSAIKEASLNNGRKMKIMSGFSYLYKTAGFAENHRLSSFLDKGIPAVAFSVGTEEQDLGIFGSLQDILVTSRSNQWSRHYHFVSLLSRGFWLNEARLIVLYLAFAFFTAMTLSFSSFRNNGRNNAELKDLSRTWFLIPLYVMLCAIALFVAQKMCPQGLSGKERMAFKFITATAITTVIATVQLYFRFRISFSALSFLLLISCALNIFLFSSIDLALMYVFTLEYMTCFFFRRWKGPAANATCMFLLALPAFHFILDILRYSSPEKTGALCDSSFGINLLLSAALLPFLIQWLILSLSLHVIDKRQNTKRRLQIVKAIINCIVTTSLVSVFFIAGSRIKTGARTVPTAATPEEGLMTSLSFSQEDSSDLVVQKIDVSCIPEARIVRCRVELEDQERNPLYECNFNYDMEGTRKAIIEIPDWPPEKFSIVYSRDSECSVSGTARLWIEKEDGSVIVDEKHFSGGSVL